jgi:3-dehydrosphinganine reductase
VAVVRVLVTGGSEGIGFAVAAEAVRAGADVEIWARQEDKLKAACAKLNAIRVNAAHWRRVDVSDPLDVRTAAEKYLAHGPPDRLFHCAGFAVAAFLDDVADNDVEMMFAVNAMGSIYVARAIAPAMAARKSGAIVLTSSDLGFIGLFGWSVYAATKHAVVGFASSLRNELKPFGVSVQALCPPATQTPGFDRENETKPRSVRKAEQAGGVMSPEDVARTAWARAGRGGLHIIPNRTSRILFALTRVSLRLAHGLVRAPGPGQPR